MPVSEPLSDDLFTFTELAVQLKRPASNPIHRGTLSRWVIQGVRAGKGRVKLIATSIGGRWFVKWSDWLAFQQECTRRKGGATERMETPAEREREAKKDRAAFEKIFGPLETKPRKQKVQS